MVRCSFVQIYNEQIMDLLNPSHLQQAKRSRTKHHSKARTGLRLRWSAAREFYVENLCVLECESPEQVLAHFHSGLQHKVMASHRMNAASSRSHCIFTLYVESFDPSDNPNDVLTSKLALVDLAGSERVERTGATGVTLQESIGINKSLFVLRQVIQALSEESNAVPAKELLIKAPNDRAYIPYRDSKLTSLLKESLGGNSVTLMIACISPSDASFDENLSTLVYASKAQCIANRPTKNEDPKTALVHELQQEVECLRRQLNQAHTTILSFQQLTPAHSAIATDTKMEERRSTAVPEAKTLPGALPSEPNEKPQARRETNTTKQLKWNVIENVDMIKQLYSTEKQLSERVRSQAERMDALQYETRVLNVENQSLREKMEVLEYLVATGQSAAQGVSNNEDEGQEPSEIPEYGAVSKQSLPVPTAERIRRALRHKVSVTATPTSSKRKSKIAPHTDKSNQSSGSGREPENTGLLSVRELHLVQADVTKLTRRLLQLSELKDLLAGGKQTKRVPMAPRTAPQSTDITSISNNQQPSLPRSTTASILSTLRQRTTTSVLEQGRPLWNLSGSVTRLSRPFGCCRSAGGALRAQSTAPSQSHAP